MVSYRKGTTAVPTSLSWSAITITRSGHVYTPPRRIFGHRTRLTKGTSIEYLEEMRGNKLTDGDMA
ncbi:hypothetical protein [Spirosoma sordidisoli]|uniref:Uncharacterized protein n=1 Tax=Spirosoma sordidisoli TaxID=2502893 RepID=A0A4Q2UJ76_9BACT|nr:hypothetical protein [Spirosoma sordidisoli]RYC69527.1 hypothetical protein EQG79_13050 [Spirosoma sordidisoli]